MNEHQKALKGLLGVLALLAIVGAVWRVLTYQQGTAHRVATSSSSAEMAQPVVQDVHPVSETVRELLSEPTPVVSPAADVSKQAGANALLQPLLSQRMGYPQNRAVSKQPYPTHAPTGKRYVDQNFYSPDHKTPSAYPKGTSYQASNFTGPQVNLNAPASARVQEERASMLAPYLRPNRQEKARMDAQWNKMAAAIERAVLKALMPKSKREEMLEKYAAKSTENTALQESGFSGPLAPVGQQIALQKQQMMQSMGQAFGASAAQQAGGIMDSFSGEVANALNASNATAEQKAEKVQELSRKYQDKMDKLAEQKQYDKFVAERVAQINQQKEELRVKYGNELSDQLGQNLEEEWQLEQQLATKNLPLDEYNTQLAQLHQTKRNERQQLVISQGQSINPMLEMEKKEEEAALQALKAKVEAGEVESVARAATPNEIQRMQADMQVKSKDTLDRIAKDPLLGPKAAAEFKPILDNYQQQLNRLYQQELSIDERRDQENKLLKDVNRQLLDKQIESVEKLDMPDVQKQHILEELNQAYNAI